MTVQDPTSSAYTIRLPVYEGPLGLLLYLIKKNEIDIYDIPVAQVAVQYQQHLEMLQDLNLEIAGEFFVMAATLIQIKSRMLLPRPERPDGTREDPREDLVNQLLEFQRIQEAARTLEVRQEESAHLFVRPRGAGEDLPLEGAPLLEVDLFALVAAFHSILQAERWRRPLELEGERFTVAEKMVSLEIAVREAGGRMEFLGLFGQMSCREEMVAAFLALLELLKARKLRCAQEAPMGPIVVFLRSPEDAVAAALEEPAEPEPDPDPPAGPAGEPREPQ